MDQSGQYYYQSGSGDAQQVMTVVSGIADPNAETGDAASSSTFVMRVEGVNSDNIAGDLSSSADDVSMRGCVS